MSHPGESFDKLFEANDDPWSFRTRWYEERKRQLTLACLPARRFRFGYEPGCANGELSSALATRCDRLLVSDAAFKAVALARARLSEFAHVAVTQAAVPADWPQQRFDLIVVSELGYYLSPPMLLSLADSAKRSLTDNGVLLACHWRSPIEGCQLTGDAVHELLDERLAMHRLAHHTELDFVMDVWCIDPRSVAEQESIA